MMGCLLVLENMITLEKLEFEGLKIGVCRRLEELPFFSGNSFFFMTFSICGVSSPISDTGIYKIKVAIERYSIFFNQKNSHLESKHIIHITLIHVHA